MQSTIDPMFKKNIYIYKTAALTNICTNAQSTASSYTMLSTVFLLFFFIWVLCIMILLENLATVGTVTPKVTHVLFLAF